MKVTANARWFVIAGACLAFLGFFLPCVNVSYSAETFIEGIGYSDSETVSLASGEGSLYFIPVSFIATIILNFVFHSPNIQHSQRNTIYIMEWATAAFGLFYSIYVIIQTNSALSDYVDSYNESILGVLVQQDAKVMPGFGIFVMLIGFGLIVYGLKADGLESALNLSRKDRYHEAQSRLFSREGSALQQNRQVQTQQDFNRYSESLNSSVDLSEGEAVPAMNPSISGVVAPIAVHPQEREKEKISAWLVCRDGKNFQLNAGETTIGRASSNDIQFSNPRISKQHAKIIAQHGSYHIVDRGSTNGTWVNGRRVKNPIELHTEDVIRFGDSYEVQFAAYDQNRSTI